MSKMRILFAKVSNLLEIQLKTNSSAKTLLLPRNIATTNQLCLDQKWRDNQRLPKNPNSDGPLVNLPDYSFLDGRPVPFGTRQKKRILQQRELAAKVVQYIGEVDFAKKRYHKIKNHKNDIESPLKPKGHLLLKN